MRRLKFGVPLKNICIDGILPPALEELFTKAYNSASRVIHEEELLPLRNYGSTAECIKLKERLEAGRSILDVEASPGAPLWVLRHFFGCLPEPLLKRDCWSNAASQSSVAVQHVINDGVIVRPVHKIIARSMSALPGEERSVLTSLVQLIRNLSAAAGRASVLHGQQYMKYLVHYFAASLISRPYFAGILTKEGKRNCPLLLILCHDWLKIRSHVTEICFQARLPRSYKTQKPHHGMGDAVVMNSGYCKICHTSYFSSNNEASPLARNMCDKAIQCTLGYISPRNSHADPHERQFGRKKSNHIYDIGDNMNEICIICPSHTCSISYSNDFGQEGGNDLTNVTLPDKEFSEPENSNLNADAGFVTMAKISRPSSNEFVSEREEIDNESNSSKLNEVTEASTRESSKQFFEIQVNVADMQREKKIFNIKCAIHHKSNSPQSETQNVSSTPKQDEIFTRCSTTAVDTIEDLATGDANIPLIFENKSSTTRKKNEDKNNDSLNISSEPHNLSQDNYEQDRSLNEFPEDKVNNCLGSEYNLLPKRDRNVFTRWLGNIFSKT